MQGPELLDGKLHRSLIVLTGGGVHFEGESLSVGITDFPGHPLSGRQVDVGGDDSCAVCGEIFRGGFSESGAGSGDEGYFSVERGHVFSFILCGWSPPGLGWAAPNGA